MQGRVGELDAGRGRPRRAPRPHRGRAAAGRRTRRRTAGRRARRRTSGGLAAGPHRGAVGRSGAQGWRRVAASKTEAAQDFSARSPKLVKVQCRLRGRVGRGARFGCRRGGRRRASVRPARPWPRSRRPTAAGRPSCSATGRCHATAPAGALPGGARWALDLVEAPARLRGAMTAHARPVSSWSTTSTAALELVAADPELRAVTPDGDLVGPGWVSGGSDRKPSTLEITSEIEKARTELAAAETRPAELTRRVVRVRWPSRPPVRTAAEQALAALNESDAAISAIYEQLGRLGQDARAADEEWQRLMRQREELEAGRDADRRRARRTRDPAAQRAAGARRVDADEPVEPSARSPRPPKPPAAPRWRPGWRCAPPRNARMPFAGGRIRCAARPPPNARRGCAPSGRGQAREHAAAVAAAVAESGPQAGAAAGRGGRRRRRASATSWPPNASSGSTALAAVRERGQRAEHPDRRAHRVAAPRRGRQGAGGAAYRAARAAWCSSSSAWRRRPGRRVRPGRAAAAVRAGDGRIRAGPRARRAGHRAGADAVRPAHPGASRQAGRARTGRTGPGQPAGAGGVRRAGGALQLPVHPARGRQGRPQGPARRRRRRRRPHPAGVHRGLRRRGTRVPRGVRRRCSPAARAGCCSPIPTTC